MENGHTAEQNRDFASQKADVACPVAMDTLKTGIICCLLGNDLAFLWGGFQLFQQHWLFQGKFLRPIP